MTDLVGVGTLSRLVLRRDRVVIAVWVLLLAAVMFGFAAGMQSLYPTAASRQAFTALIVDNPSMVALYGPVYGSSVGGLTAWRSVFVLLGVAIAALLTVVRHTRTDEEAGRRELVGATVTGRHASSAAALLVTFGSTLLLSAFITLGLIVGGLPVAGSVAEGLAVGAVGMVFGAVAALCAQLTESARSARAIASGVLAGTFLLRVVGDTGSSAWLSWLSWVSPFGLVQRVRPFVGERWWLFAPTAALVIVLVGLAFALEARRDLGAGLLPVRPRPAQGAPALRSPYALASRLHRGTLLVWTVAFAVGGVAFGGAADGAAQMLDDNAQMRAAFERLGGATSAVDAFLAAVFVYTGTIAAVYAIQVVLRLRAEELGNRAEPLLATPVSRSGWTISHLVFAFGGPVVLMAAAGVSSGLIRGLGAHDVGHEIVRLLGAGLVQLPAVWVLPSLTIAIVGLMPRWTPLAWAAVVIFALLGEFGAMFKLNKWVQDVSPFHHTPQLPGGTFTATPLIWLLLVSAALVLAGLLGMRRRDIG